MMMTMIWGAVRLILTDPESGAGSNKKTVETNFLSSKFGQKIYRKIDKKI